MTPKENERKSFIFIFWELCEYGKVWGKVSTMDRISDNSSIKISHSGWQRNFPAKGKVQSLS